MCPGTNFLVVSVGMLMMLIILTWVDLDVGHPLVVCPRRLEVEVIGQATRVLDGRLSHLSPGLVPQPPGDVKLGANVVILWEPGTEGSYHQWQDGPEVSVLLLLVGSRAVQVRGVIEGDGDVDVNRAVSLRDRDVRYATAILKSLVGDRLDPKVPEKICQDSLDPVVPSCHLPQVG